MWEMLATGRAEADRRSRSFSQVVPGVLVSTGAGPASQVIRGPVDR